VQDTSQLNHFESVNNSTSNPKGSLELDFPLSIKNKNDSKLNIFQIAPICLPITNKLRYAGIERLIFYLDRQFCRLRHKSTLAATKNSKINGKLLPIIEKHLWKCRNTTKTIVNDNHLYKKAFKKLLQHLEISHYDIIHIHDLQFITYCVDNKLKLSIPILVTMHGPVKKISDLKKIKTKNIFFNTISKSQCLYFSSKGFCINNWVYNGIDIKSFPYREEKDNYLLMVGRISKDKGHNIAINIAKKIGSKLIIAGPIHDVNKKFYKNKIKPKIDRKQIIFKGEVSTKERNKLYAKAKCLLMPIQWEEPFGLVVIEAMACGTPVIAFNRGSIPELIKDGETGYIVNNEKEMIEAIKKINKINPEDCRKWVEKRFTSKRMADDYLKLYKNCIDSVNS
jgi:glycosyltransferase involved in cell wall biosynthesis